MGKGKSKRRNKNRKNNKKDEMQQVARPDTSTLAAAIDNAYSDTDFNTSDGEETDEPTSVEQGGAGDIVGQVTDELSNLREAAAMHEAIAAAIPGLSLAANQMPPSLLSTQNAGPAPIGQPAR